MASFGADIPTTPIFWKKETNRLQWFVRQMSWSPPWVADKQDDTVRENYEDRRRVAIEQNFHKSSKKTDTPVGNSVPPVPISRENAPEVAQSTPASSAPTMANPAQNHASVNTVDTADATVARYESLWLACSTGHTVDTYGYGRSPAFWSTLNCPYNYLHEIYRFQEN